MGLKGIVASTLVAGAVFTGVAYTWDGGSAIDAAKNKIAQLTGSNATMKANEGKLITKVNGLKGQIETLKADVASKQQQIDDLIAQGGDNTEYIAELQAEIEANNAKIAELNAQIEKLNADLTASDADGEALGKEIQRLQGELQEANTDAQELQASVNEAGTVEESDQAAVDAALSGETVTPPPTETEDGGEEPTAPTEDPYKDYLTLNMIADTPTIIAENNKMKIDKKLVDGEYHLIAINLDMTNSWTVNIDGTPTTIGASNTTDLGTAASLDGKPMTVKNYMTGVEYKYVLKNQ